MCSRRAYEIYVSHLSNTREGTRAKPDHQLRYKHEEIVKVLPVRFHICRAASQPQTLPQSLESSPQACSCQKQATSLHSELCVGLHATQKLNQQIMYGTAHRVGKFHRCNDSNLEFGILWKKYALSPIGRQVLQTLFSPDLNHSLIILLTLDR